MISPNSVYCLGSASLLRYLSFIPCDDHSSIFPRLGLKLTCNMHLATFPMDHQQCKIEIETCKYPDSQPFTGWWRFLQRSTRFLDSTYHSPSQSSLRAWIISAREIATPIRVHLETSDCNNLLISLSLTKIRFYKFCFLMIFRFLHNARHEAYVVWNKSSSNWPRSSFTTVPNIVIWLARNHARVYNR